MTVSTLAAEATTSPDINTTTLYPVFNNTITRNEIHTRFKDTETRPSDTEERRNDTETHQHTELRLNEKTAKLNNTETISNKTDTKSKPATQSWKIESGFAPLNLTEDENITDTEVKQEKKELIKDFKPSQHLGSFFDDDRVEFIKTPVFGPVEKKPAGGFIR